MKPIKKLGKDEIQKLVLGILLLFGIVYSYFDLLLRPLNKRIEITQQAVVGLGPEIDAAKAQIAKTNQMEKDSPMATLPVRQAEAMIPEGAPVAWFPVRMAEFFKKLNIDKVTTRITGDAVEKSLPGFRKVTWGIDFPKVEFAPFGRAIAELENNEPLLEINTVQMDAARDDVEVQHAFFSVNNLVKQ